MNDDSMSHLCVPSQFQVQNVTCEHKSSKETLVTGEGDVKS